MSDYQAARKRVEAIRDCDGYGNAVLRVYGHEPAKQFYTDLALLLAGPPEPSVEEVARVIMETCMDRGGEWVVASRAAQAVQALYRSKTND